MAAKERTRASPEALLAVAEREGRGRLRVFLGAAPGVGKTFAMLQAAKTARHDGIDVVVGLVETHGRADTQAMVAGLPDIARTSMPHRGRMVAEFDLDAALRRHPKLLLLDEYAHSNAPGSRHPKRWQDVEELLDAGIDVWTTLNVQHLESLNDVVQRITRVRVRETVPDQAFDDADEIVLVDLPPDELLKRLAEGKVYVQDTAAKAVQNFFRTDNLIALRELALRRAAERIDSALLEHMQGRAIDGPWPAGERILVCVGPDLNSPRVVRHAKRLADRIGAPLIAVTVERPGSAPAPASQAAMQLAESLGAETKVLFGSDTVEEVLRFARFENVTQIVTGRSRAGCISELLGRSLSHEFISRTEQIPVQVVTEGDAPAPPAPRKLPDLFSAGAPPVAYLLSAAAVAVTIVAGRGLSAAIPLPNVSLIFLLAVLFAAVQFGIWPAVFASVLSFAGYNFFFIDPLYTFTVARPHELLALLVFLAVAVLTSALAGRARYQARAAAGRARSTLRLYDFARRMSGIAAPGAVAEGAAIELHAGLQRPALILLPRSGDLVLAASWPPEDALDPATLSAARWAFEKAEAAGADTGTLPSVPWYFVPLATQGGPIGVIGVADVVDGIKLDGEARTLLGTVAELTAAALDRARLAREIGEARAQAETERVRNTLLASISHDFRTPLASILGAATSLIDYGDKLPASAHADLLGQVKDEAEHLDGMVRNLLSMTRVEANALELRRDWIDVREVLQRVAAQARRRGAAQAFEVSTPAELPFVLADASLIDQALANIVDNAVRYGGAGATIRLAAARDGEDVVLTVTDDGPGIAAPVLPHIFEKFVRGRGRGEGGDGGEGTGLGLAIAKGIVEAHGGFIEAASPAEDGHGARITLRLPVGPDVPA